MLTGLVREGEPGSCHDKADRFLLRRLHPHVHYLLVDRGDMEVSRVQRCGRQGSGTLESTTGAVTDTYDERGGENDSPRPTRRVHDRMIVVYAGTVTGYGY